MYTSLKFVSIAALLGLAAAADNSTSGGGDSSGSGVQIVVKNDCGYDLDVGHLTNGQSSAQSDHVAQGSSKSYPFDSKWQGRFWARQQCSGDECSQPAGAGHPASLAEFTFKGAGGNDYYDLSLVDGFNLPVSISPIDGKKGGGEGKYQCGSPSCSKAPSCPSELKVYENGKEVGCQSACSRFKTDEYCCSGSNGTPDKCSPNMYSKSVKESCPDAYSYAYDDKSSTYQCQASGYTVTFCPSGN